MEDPAREMAEVARLVTGATDPEVQDAAVLKYYAPDMAFRHPLCAVSPAPDSRADLLAILAWYRILSPVLVDIDAVSYDAERRTAYVEATRVFCVRWSPFTRAPAKLLIRFKLRPTPSPADPSKTVYLIAEHEDFYHHEDVAAMFVPPLAPLVRFGLRVATLACKMNVRLFRALGCWTRSIQPEEGEGGRSVVAEDEELTSRGNRKKGGKDD
ncbi:hypothetical protein K466DRAFT_499445 [Polyporus arcularius HHB13444]|uniref:SigF-like NTF2-like domain-containing protein n=1 Tax=Polyporus arcularius HHB13444 TaxID=1314778 RepID=A0A5C3NZQ3_9APHY|nr:hypothetical protein K466DRAFT_499445 [Polyporus arcularius HHB13444]